MTYYFKNTYIEECSTVCGPYEKNGPLRRYYDKSYKDLYFGEDSWEKAEIKLVKDALVMILKKSGYTKDEIDIVIGGAKRGRVSRKPSSEEHCKSVLHMILNPKVSALSGRPGNFLLKPLSLKMFLFPMAVTTRMLSKT